MKRITREELNELDQRYRTHLINSVSGFKNLNLVGTISENQKPNLALFNSIFHLGANPPLLGMVFRPDGPEHDTFNNIIQTGQYTLNNVRENFYKQAHQCSARYRSGESEFLACGLDEEYLNAFRAPFVKQSSIKIGLELREVLPVSLNGTRIMIGEIQLISVGEGLISDDGYVSIEQGGTLTCSGLDSYHRTEKISRLSYAKPDRFPDVIG